MPLSKSQIQTDLRAFLLDILPDGVEVIAAQTNRVPEPASSDFVLITPLHLARLATNEVDNADCVFTGSISGTTLTVTALTSGALAPGRKIFGTGVQTGTKIVSDLGNDQWEVSVSQDVDSESMSAGQIIIRQRVQVSYQLDIHGPASVENAATISTLFRDAYAAVFFADRGNGTVPLYCSDPAQAPFINAEQQYEERWTITAEMEAQTGISVSQEFGDTLTVSVVSEKTL